MDFDSLSFRRICENISRKCLLKKDTIKARENNKETVSGFRFRIDGLSLQQTICTNTRLKESKKFVGKNFFSTYVKASIPVTLTERPQNLVRYYAGEDGHKNFCSF